MGDQGEDKAPTSRQNFDAYCPLVNHPATTGTALLVTSEPATAFEPTGERGPTRGVRGELGGTFPRQLWTGAGGSKPGVTFPTMRRVHAHFFHAFSRTNEKLIALTRPLPAPRASPATEATTCTSDEFCKQGVECIVLVLGVGRCAFRPPRVVFVLRLVSLINSLTSAKTNSTTVLMPKT